MHILNGHGQLVKGVAGIANLQGQALAGSLSAVDLDSLLKVLNGFEIERSCLTSLLYQRETSSPIMTNAEESVAGRSSGELRSHLCHVVRGVGIQVREIHHVRAGRASRCKGVGSAAKGDCVAVLHHILSKIDIGAAQTFAAVECTIYDIGRGKVVILAGHSAGAGDRDGHVAVHQIRRGRNSVGLYKGKRAIALICDSKVLATNLNLFTTSASVSIGDRGKNCTCNSRSCHGSSTSCGHGCQSSAAHCNGDRIVSCKSKFQIVQVNVKAGLAGRSTGILMQNRILAQDTAHIRQVGGKVSGEIRADFHRAVQQLDAVEVGGVSDTVDFSQQLIHFLLEVVTVYLIVIGAVGGLAGQLHHTVEHIVDLSQSALSGLHQGDAVLGVLLSHVQTSNLGPHLLRDSQTSGIVTGAIDFVARGQLFKVLR